MEEVLEAQESDAGLCEVKQRLIAGDDLPKDCGLQSVKNQLSVVDGIVCRSLKLVSSDVQVPVLPSSLQSQAVAAIHRRTGSRWLGHHVAGSERGVFLSRYG